MEGTSLSSFPANYVTLKDLQERWIKRKQDEENEEKLRRLREQEEIKSHNEKETKNHRRKSKNPIRSVAKSPSSPAAPASHSQRRERKVKNLAIVKEFDAKSGTSTAIACRKMKKKQRSGRSRIPPSESELVVEIADKREEKEGKGLESERGDQLAEICRTVEDLSVSSSSNRRGERIFGVGAYSGRRGGGKAWDPASGTRMVWVRKTTDG